jgi:hypothetical protein
LALSGLLADLGGDGLRPAKLHYPLVCEEGVNEAQPDGCILGYGMKALALAAGDDRSAESH